jgi:hypothetical protein
MQIKFLGNFRSRQTKVGTEVILANATINSNFYLMPKLKTSDGGLHLTIGHEPGHEQKLPTSLLTFPHLRKILKEKSTKIEEIYNNDYTSALVRFHTLLSFVP